MPVSKYNILLLIKGANIWITVYIYNFNKDRFWKYKNIDTLVNDT